jgi:S1-C subfamily serine protease
MRRLVFLILFVLLTIVALVWLTGIEGPFSEARTHSVLSKSVKIVRSGSSAESGKPAGTSLLLGTNVDSTKQTMGKQQLSASALVPSLVAVSENLDFALLKDGMGKKIIGKMAEYGIQSNLSGSGFFIDKQGTILTNFSTLLGSSAWTVYTSDGEELDAELIGVDVVTDLALLRVNKANTVPVKWANTPPNFAETLLMLGFDRKDGPRVLEVMTSSGMLGNSPDEEDILWEHYLVDYDSMDKRSGWLLLNMDGGVVGMVTHIGKPGSIELQETVVASSRSIAPVIDALQNEGSLHRAYLGIDSKELNSSLAKLLGIKKETGLLVEKVSADSPLAHAGLKTGDIILSFGDKIVSSKMQLYKTAADIAIGAKVPMEVQRGQEQIILQVVLLESKDGVQDLQQQWLNLVANQQKKRVIH